MAVEKYKIKRSLENATKAKKNISIKSNIKNNFDLKDKSEFNANEFIRNNMILS